MLKAPDQAWETWCALLTLPRVLQGLAGVLGEGATRWKG